MQDIQNAWTCGHTYMSEPQQSQPSRPKAARDHGYTQNHMHYQNQLDAWSLKASSNGNLKDAVAVRVYIGYVRPGKKNVSVAGVSPMTSLNASLSNCMFTYNHCRVALKV
jgi:hypothetical protein